MEVSNIENANAQLNLIVSSLSAIWSELLNHESIKLDDSFFFLGSDSITVLKLLFRVEQTFQVRLLFRDIFDNPTIYSQSLLIQERVNNLD